MLKISRLPREEPVCENYSVQLNHETNLPCYTARVSAMPYNTWWPGCQRPIDQTEIAYFASFETDLPINVSVTVKKPFSEVVIRPLSKNIIPKMKDNIIEFAIDKPGQYSIEPDGFHNPLTLFVNPITNFNIDENNSSVIYFGAGIHHPGIIEVKSGQTIYIDAGAIVYGSVIGINVDNVCVTGYGILDGSNEERGDDTLLLPLEVNRIADASPKNTERTCFEDTDELKKFLKETKTLNGCIRFYNSKNIKISGITCRDAATFTIIPANCDNVVFDNIKLIGMWRYNSDGIDIFNCTNVLIKNCYLRNFDDCIVLKGIIGWDERNVENILVQNCVVWCDWGRCLEIGAETCADEFRNITFEDCDLIHGTHMMLDIQNADRAHVHDVLFKNIRCEYNKHQLPAAMQSDLKESYTGKDGFAQPYLFRAHSYCGVFSNDNKLGRISNITLKDIYILCDDELTIPETYIEGAEERYNTTEHNTVNVKFDGIFLNGHRLQNTEEANIIINKKTSENVMFIP